MNKFTVGYNSGNLMYEARFNNETVFKATSLEWLEFLLKGHYLNLPPISKYVDLFDRTVLIKTHTNTIGNEYSFTSKCKITGIE